jgi:3-hydroxyisobutyrate dehydrogenase-like beta-hydroxyacid dehydrogenase
MPKRASKRRPQGRFDQGLAVRRRVLGPRYVDEAMRAADDFTLPLQEHKLAQFVLSRRFDAGFSLALMVKDLGTALEPAGDTATPAAFARECHALWTRAAEALEPGADHTAVVRWLETLAGTTLGES